MAYLVARLLATGSNPDISQIYKMGDISKGVANTLKSDIKINIQKKVFNNVILTKF